MTQFNTVSIYICEYILCGIYKMYIYMREREKGSQS